MAKSIKKPRVEKSKVIRSQEDVGSGNLFVSSVKAETSKDIANTDYKDNVIVNSNSFEKKNIERKDVFDLSKNLYVEVHKANLLQYFSSACIFPNRYSTQKAFSDTQSINENGLLISNGVVSNSKDSILIQIDQSAINTSLISITENFGLYGGIVPISRIIKIFVQDNETKNKIINDSIIRDTGVVTENLIESQFPPNLATINYNELIIDFPPEDFKLKKYDKILGLIAGSKNFNLLTFNETGKYKSVSDHSLFAIQAIDASFASEILDNGSLSDYYKWLFENSCPDDRPLLSWIFNRVYDSKNFTDIDTDEFESLCHKTESFLGEERQMKNIFTALRKSLERKKILLDIIELKSKNSLALYVFAYLRNYGTNQNPELPRLELVFSKVNKFSEYAFATLNFFFGYKQLRNFEERLTISDDTIKQILQLSKPSVKFDLMTEFDYKIIDSVFNFVFGIKINDLTRYKNITVEKDIKITESESYDLYKNIIYGKLYVRISKSNVLEHILPLLSKLPNEIIIFSEFGLLCHHAGLKRYFIGFEELIGNPKSILKFVHYSKQDLITAITQNKIDFEEIKQRITLSKKYNEL